MDCSLSSRPDLSSESMKEHSELLASVLMGRSQTEGQARKHSQVREVTQPDKIKLISTECHNSTSGVIIFHSKNIRL